MDLSLIKNKLDSFQSKGEKREKIDYTKIFWVLGAEGQPHSANQPNVSRR